MPRRNRWWLWGSRAVFAVLLAGLVVYLVRVGLEKADKVASGIGAVLALMAFGLPYLLRPSVGDTTMKQPDHVKDSGKATATAGGQANTGVDAAEGDERPAHVTDSGNAHADGSGSVANTGVQRRPRP